MKGGARPSLFVALSFPNLKKMYQFTAGLTESFFQSSHSEAQPEIHTLRDFSPQ